MSGFNEEKGKRFFKSTLIQTLFYGIFSAWVLWHKQDEEGKFDWRTAGYYLRVPMIQALFDRQDGYFSELAAAGFSRGVGLDNGRSR
ncbi:hypothetical protein [Nostoc sp. FACHB-888]|uniref:hypothetical protein n=1 Tax=Nostoc sp. FACHB-888 TaxID=2692842 RepID=UPI0018F01D0D|nr:hypothetical protein [Nostoc sp. FACHB-888]